MELSSFEFGLHLFLPICSRSAICKDIELKFGTETNFGPLSSKTNINLEFDVIMTCLAFRLFCW